MGQPLDLFAAAGPEGAYSVGDVARRARQLIEGGLGPVWVRGEVTGLKRYQSGHWYFTLRDRSAQLRCVMWAKENRRLPTAPADGLEVFVLGRPTVWEERGEFRLTVVELLSTAAGGLWQLAFERAKAALSRDGLLDPARKRPLPAYPERIAVVTSRDGAALRDILAVARRRWPLAEVLVVPTRVQGEGAEDDVCAALAVLGRVAAARRVDVAIVGRGGGSKEDLWTFNSERVARAVAAAAMPVVSAVGHETDVTLCDLVADHRAATPSAAAEAVTPDRAEVAVHLGHLAQRLARGLRARAARAVERLDRTADRLVRDMRLRIERQDDRLTAVGARLDALSPLKVLARGYAVARDAEGRVLRRVAQLPPGQAFRLRVVDGTVSARVVES
jgi:exodeoxyribonuclease VII large subunit